MAIAGESDVKIAGRRRLLKAAAELAIRHICSAHATVADDTKGLDADAQSTESPLSLISARGSCQDAQ
jgi:hypothetical protein